MAKRVLELRFPSAGVVRRMGFGLTGRREKYPTPFAVNVRPEDPLAKRLRGGSRPGLTEYTGGNEPEWPTSELVTEADAEITTEAGAEILLYVLGSSVLWPEVAKALAAYGYGDLPETLTATVGTAPGDGTLGCTYRDRLVVSGGSHVVYMSRQGDWADWDYGAEVEDTGRAVILQLSEASEIGDTVTALVPHRDAFLLAATEHGLWIIENDPAGAGTLRNISRHVGIISNTAWCKAGDLIFFLSSDGLYSVAGNGTGLKNISGEALPEELHDVDLTTTDVVMGYNHGESGVYIFLVGGDYHWYYDLQFGGFWPFTLPSAADPVAAFQVDGQMIMWDGTSTFYEIGGDDDDGADIESHLLVGPIVPGSAAEFGLLSALHGIVHTETSGSVTWRIVTGDTAEDACDRAKTALELHLAGSVTAADAYAADSGTWSDGRSYVSHPRVRAMWMVIWLSSDDKWAYETIIAELQKFGNWR